MTTEWVDRWIILVQMNRLAAANGFARAWDPDTGGEYTFGAIRLSETGEEPATWTGCNTAAKANMTTAIQAALGAVPWARVYDAKEWNWESALEDAGLQQIIEPVIEDGIRKTAKFMDWPEVQPSVHIAGRDIPVSTHVIPAIKKIAKKFGKFMRGRHV